MGSSQNHPWTHLSVDFSTPYYDEPLQLLPDTADDYDDSTCDCNSDHDNYGAITNENSTQIQQNEGAHDDTIPSEEDSSELEKNALENSNIQGASANADESVDTLGANENADDLGASENFLCGYLIFNF